MIDIDINTSQKQSTIRKENCKKVKELKWKGSIKLSNSVIGYLHNNKSQQSLDPQKLSK